MAEKKPAAAGYTPAYLQAELALSQPATAMNRYPEPPRMAWKTM